MILRSSHAHDAEVRTLDDTEWRAFEQRNPPPTFFARRAWMAACAAHIPGASAQAFEVRADGVVAIVPALRLPSRLGFSVVDATPRDGYSAVLVNGGALTDPRACCRVLEVLAASLDAFSYTPWPLAPIGDVFGHACEHETSVIDLRDGIDAVMKRMKGVTRRMAGQADRRGVECARTRAPEALDVYYDLLCASAQRWGIGTPTISREFMRSVMECGGDDAQLWLAYSDGTPIGGGIMLYGASEAFFWTAAMDERYAHLRPSNALNVALLEDACARGLAWYNMGASKGIEGVARFKRSLGAQALSYRSYHRYSRRYAGYDRLRALGSRVGNLRFGARIPHEDDATCS